MSDKWLDDVRTMNDVANQVRSFSSVLSLIENGFCVSRSHLIDPQNASQAFINLEYPSFFLKEISQDNDSNMKIAALFIIGEIAEIDPIGFG